MANSKIVSMILIGIVIGFWVGFALQSFDNKVNCVDNETLINQTRAAFQYGTNYGMEYAVATITNESLQCNQIPMNYSGYVYTLYPLECLDLNLNGGNK